MGAVDVRFPGHGPASVERGNELEGAAVRARAIHMTATAIVNAVWDSAADGAVPVLTRANSRHR